MSTLSKKLFISVLTLIVTVGAFAATTFAWFTLGNQSNIGQFESEVTAGDGLEVQFDGNNIWHNSINNTQMGTYLTAKYSPNPIVMNTVTNADGKGTFTKPSFLEDSVVKTSEYIEFKLNFRSKTSGSVAWIQASLSSNGTTWLADTPFTGANGNSILESASVNGYASNAARISVEGTNTIVVEQTVGTNGNVVGSGKDDKGAINYYNAKTGTTAATDATLPSFPTYTNIATLGESSVVLVLADDTSGTGYFIGSVTVRVWLEGWDYDAYNNILGDTLKTSLSFKKVA